MRTPAFIAPRARAFSLIEVVAAIGIFAVGMVAVIALFAPLARSVAGLSEAEAATNVAETLRDELARRAAAARSFAPITALLKNSTARSHELTVADNAPNAAASDPRRDPQLLFVSRDGAKIGAYADTAVWGATDAEKFFEVALIRNETLSPVANDTATPPPVVLAYTARIRWPAFVPDATPTNPLRALPFGYNPTGAVQFDHGQQQVLHVAGSVTR
jgi:type II secretory pathway pseudopilin PulG